MTKTEMMNFIQHIVEGQAPLDEKRGLVRRMFDQAENKTLALEALLDVAVVYWRIADLAKLELETRELIAETTGRE